jgi:cytochrome c-type biogenesis protein CcmH
VAGNSGIAIGAVLVAAGLAFGVVPALAVQPDEVLPDPALEQRARDLSAGLRCLVCQNQSIDDSDAPLARDLRILVRERLKAGESDERVRDFVVQRYGEFVLLKPLFGAKTLLLWLTPALVLAGGAVALGLALRRRSERADAVPLTPQERAALDAILRPDHGGEPKLTKDSSA